MKDSNRTKLLDGIRIINILRGRIPFDNDSEFERKFSKTWRISLRSLYKEYDIEDL